MRNPIITDIAKIAGVSIATVSRVINNKETVNIDTKKKVLEVVERMNYRPNPVGRMLATSRTENIGLLFSRVSSFRAMITEKYYAGIFEGILSYLRETIYNVLLIDSKRIKNSAELPRPVSNRNIDGLLAIGPLEEMLLIKIIETKIPFVLIGHHHRNFNVLRVVNDNAGGAYKAVEYLVSLGHKRIGFIGGGTLGVEYIEDSFNGYKKALSVSNIPFDENLVQLKEKEFKSSIDQLLKTNKDLSAIYFVDDRYAMPGMEYIKSRGLRVPEDISVISMGDEKGSADSKPPLTTIRIDEQKLGEKASELLTHVIDGDNSFEREIIIPSTLLIERKSCIKR